MRPRSLAAIFSTSCAVVLTVLGLAGATAAVAGASPAPASAATPPACQTASPESITGAMFVNNNFVNGTWHYATGVACSSPLADIALYEELDHNGVKVDSRLKGFTGVARNLDAITSSVFCANCNGSWVFKWGQIMKAPSGFFFTNPTSGCVLLQNGLYELCVQTKTVTL